MDAGILVGVIVAERGRCVDVLHQQPRSGATRIIGAGVRVALLHNNKIFGRAVDFDFDNAANGFRAQFYVCHCYLSVSHDLRGPRVLRYREGQGFVLHLVDAAALPRPPSVTREFVRVDFSMDRDFTVKQFFEPVSVLAA